MPLLLALRFDLCAAHVTMKECGQRLVNAPLPLSFLGFFWCFFASVTPTTFLKLMELSLTWTHALTQVLPAPPFFKPSFTVEVGSQTLLVCEVADRKSLSNNVRMVHDHSTVSFKGIATKAAFRRWANPI